MRETASIGVILQGPHLQGAPFSWASQVALVVKCPPAKIGDIRDTGSIPGSERSPGGGKWQPTPVFLPGEFHGQSSLMGYSPWDHKVSGMTEHTLMCIYTFYIYNISC